MAILASLLLVALLLTTIAAMPIPIPDNEALSESLFDDVSTIGNDLYSYFFPYGEALVQNWVARATTSPELFREVENFVQSHSFDPPAEWPLEFDRRPAFDDVTSSQYRYQNPQQERPRPYYLQNTSALVRDFLDEPLTQQSNLLSQNPHELLLGSTLGLTETAVHDLVSDARTRPELVTIQWLQTTHTVGDRVIPASSVDETHLHAIDTQLIQPSRQIRAVRASTITEIAPSTTEGIDASVQPSQSRPHKCRHSTCSKSYRRKGDPK